MTDVKLTIQEILFLQRLARQAATHSGKDMEVLISEYGALRIAPEDAPAPSCTSGWHPVALVGPESNWIPDPTRECLNCGKSFKQKLG